MDSKVLNNRTDSPIGNLDKIAMQILSKVKQDTAAYLIPDIRSELSNFNMDNCQCQNLSSPPHIEESFGQCTLKNFDLNKDTKKKQSKSGPKKDWAAKYDDLLAHRTTRTKRYTKKSKSKINTKLSSFMLENDGNISNDDLLEDGIRRLLPDNNITKLTNQSENVREVEEILNNNLPDINVTNETVDLPVVSCNAMDNDKLLFKEKIKNIYLTFWLQFMFFLENGNANRYRVFNALITMMDIFCTVFLAVFSISICIYKTVIDLLLDRIHNTKNVLEAEMKQRSSPSQSKKIK